MENDCPFCNVPTDRIILASEYAVAFLDSYPVTKGHTLVVPVRHVYSVRDLTDEDYEGLWRLVRRVPVRIQQRTVADGFNIGFNDGGAAGQTMEHAHIHIIPRRYGDVPDPRGGIRWVIPNKADYWSPRK